MPSSEHYLVSGRKNLILGTDEPYFLVLRTVIGQSSVMLGWSWETDKGQMKSWGLPSDFFLRGIIGVLSI